MENGLKQQNIDTNDGSQLLKYFFRDLGKDIEQFEITIAIPLIVISEENGLIQVKLDGNKVDFTDIGYGLYLFVPNVFSYSYEGLIGKSKKFPIVVCNSSKLQDCLDMLKKGFNQIMYYFMEPEFLYTRHIYRELVDF